MTLHLSELLSAREIALFVWIVALVVWALLNRKVRTAVAGVVRALLRPKIISPVIGLVTWVSIVCAGLSGVHLWNASLLKDTLYWVVGAGAVALMSSATQAGAVGALRKLVIEVFTVAVVVEFVANLHSFPLWLELLALPVVALAVVMKTLGELRSEHQVVVRPLEWLLVAYGVAVVGTSVWWAANNWREFVSADSLRAFLVAPILSLAGLPYFYLFLLWVHYENAFRWLGWPLEDPELERFARRKVVFKFHFRIWALQRWSKSVGLRRVASRSELLARVAEPG